MTDQDVFAEKYFRTQDGLSLYYRDYEPTFDGRSDGSDDMRNPDLLPVLCLSGLARNSKDFAPFAARVAATGRRVLCLDYRGRGRSAYDPDPMNYQPATYLNDIRHLLSALGLHKVFVMGSSLGGILGMGMGAAMPTAIAGLMLNDVGPDIETSGFARIQGYLKQDRPQRNWDEAIADLKSIFTNNSFTDEEWRDVAEGTFVLGKDGLLHYDWDVDLYKPIAKSPEVPDLWPYFNSVRHVPVLVLRGEKSDILRSETVEKMVAAHPDISAVTVPGAGHIPTLKEPAAIEAVDEFFAHVQSNSS